MFSQTQPNSAQPVDIVLRTIALQLLSCGNYIFVHSQFHTRLPARSPPAAHSARRALAFVTLPYVRHCNKRSLLKLFFRSARSHLAPVVCQMHTIETNDLFEDAYCRLVLMTRHNR